MLNLSRLAAHRHLGSGRVEELGASLTTARKLARGLRGQHRRRAKSLAFYLCGGIIYERVG